MLVKSNVVSIDRAENLREIGKLVCNYIKYVICKHANEEGYLTYSWDDYDKDEGQFSLPLIEAYGLERREVFGGSHSASVVFMTSGRLGELLQKLDISRAVELVINNLTGEDWVKIDIENIDSIVARSIISSRFDAANIDVENFKNELAALRFLGDLH
jgi:hypothetical protein